MIMSTKEYQGVLVDFETGLLYKKVQGKWVLKSTRISDRGYVYASVGNKCVRVHRFVYSASLGHDLEKHQELNHIDQNKTNNALSNLQLCSRSENCQWVKTRSRNKSGINGVYFDKETSKWRCCININGKRKHLGRFATLEEAKLARESKVKELNLSGHMYFE